MRGPRRPGQWPFAARAERCLWNGREIDLGHNILSLKLLFGSGIVRPEIPEDGVGRCERQFWAAVRAAFISRFR